MRAIVQRVATAEVITEGRTLGKIGRGLAILLGVGRDDTEADADYILDRVIGMRIFADAAGKMNLSLATVGGALLVVSQFTLHADSSQRRPSFTGAAPPDEARRLYEYFLSHARLRDVSVESGEFGAEMQLKLVNDGPVTIIVDSRARGSGQ
ncbi:MAG TPA: D-aminoacyl-tRNA deacylase [Candidatus Binataceae bacterium]|jgi:D-tyrosyl-tRNA(Tyr) deacylase|nr:D-aminoacyl-tRNA deacylase [Candidatus Binataceae bacterium]